MPDKVDTQQFVALLILLLRWKTFKKSEKNKQGGKLGCLRVIWVKNEAIEQVLNCSFFPNVLISTFE